jgi:hypothetical protein
MIFMGLLVQAGIAALLTIISALLIIPFGVYASVPTGGSSAMVLEKWKTLLDIIEK